MIPWSQDFLCTSEGCQHRFNLIVEKSDRDKPIACVKCGETASPTWSVPMNMRASYHDGVKRRGFAELREASELESRMFDLPVSEREPVKQEIERLVGKKQGGDE